MKLLFGFKVLVVFLLVLNSCKTENEKDIYNNMPPNTLIDSAYMVDSKFLDQNGCVFYTIWERDFVSNNTCNINEYIGKINHFYPHRILSRIEYLVDNSGDEEFKSTSSLLDSTIGSRAIREIYSSDDGTKTIVKLKNFNMTLLIDLKEKKIIRKFNQTKELFGVNYINKDKLLISYDEYLIIYSILKNEITQVASNLSGPKLNPFYKDNRIYFSNNSLSEYFKIYCIDFQLDPAAFVFLESTNDLRLPKLVNNELFYISIINNEYLLNCYNIKNGTINNITTKGVVYNYQSSTDTSIVFIYSDMETPRMLKSYNLITKKIIDISKFSKIPNKVSYKFDTYTDSNIPAYFISINDKNGDRNDIIILYVHPGLKSDFSPRWHPIINTLVAEGYDVIAPNYSGSFGYGKSFWKRSLDQAVVDIEKLIVNLNKTYNTLVLLTSSSGNVIIEKILNNRNIKVNAAISLFGIPGYRLKGVFMPFLIVLGKNDPKVNYNERLHYLNNLDNENIQIVSYNGEGHWFRKKHNIKHALSHIKNFIDCL